MKTNVSKRFPRISRALLATLMVSSSSLVAQTAADSPEKQADETSPSAEPSSATTADPAAVNQPAPASDTNKTVGPASTNSAEVKQAGAPEPSKANERVIVTGSRIRQIEQQGPKPIIRVDAEEIKKSGATSVNEYLSKLTIASFGSASYGSSYGAPAGTQGFNIHGLGSSNTLVLLNGRRLVRDPYLEFIDLSIIPTAAVERIEILTGTASAIYGTDAAAGVVNIITRKDYEGTAFGYSKKRARYGGSGDHDQAYVIGGTTSERSTNIITVQWDETQGGRYEHVPWADKNYRDPYGYPFAYRGTDNGFHPGAPCSEGEKIVGTNTYCQYNYWDALQNGGPVQKVSILDDFTYNLTGSTKLGVRVFATRKTAMTSGLSDVVGTSTSRYKVSQAAIEANHPEFAGLAVPPAYTATPERDGELGVLVNGRLLGGPGSRTKTDQLTLSGTVSLAHEFANGSELEFAFSESRINRSHGWLNRFDNERLSDAIWSGEYDVFADQPQGGLDAYRLDVTDRQNAIARSAELNYTGNFSVLDRDLGYAVGISQIRESYINEASANKVNGLIKGLGGGGGEGERKANAIYGELKVPVVSTLEASIGGRWDDYTDFGDTFNSIAALQYRIGKEWFFRGNYGTGFKAPSLRDIHDSSATYFTSATDYKQCATATAAGDEALKNKYCGTAASGSIIAGGNPDLDPELSKNWGLFVGYEPVEGYGLSVEYFNSSIEDQIGSVSADDLTKLEANGKAFPTGTNVVRDPTTGDIDSYISPTTNLGVTKMDGIDTVGYAKQTFSFGTLSFRTNYNYLLRYLYNNLPGEALESGLEKAGPRWKWNNTLGYSVGVHSVSILSRTSGKIYKGVESYGMLGSYTRYELNYGLDIGDYASINVGGDNIFNQMYPRDNSDVIFQGGGITPTYYAKIDFRI